MENYYKLLSLNETVRQGGVATKFIIGGNTKKDDNGRFVNIGDNKSINISIYQSNDYDRKLVYKVPMDRPLYSINGAIRDKYDILNGLYYEYCGIYKFVGNETFNVESENDLYITFSTSIVGMKNNSGISYESTTSIEDVYVNGDKICFKILKSNLSNRTNYENVGTLSISGGTSLPLLSAINSTNDIYTDDMINVEITYTPLGSSTYKTTNVNGISQFDVKSGSALDIEMALTSSQTSFKLKCGSDNLLSTNIERVGKVSNVVINTKHNVNQDDFRKYLNANNFSVIYELDNPIIPSEIVGNSIQDNYYPSPMVASDVESVCNEKGQLEVHSLSIDDESNSNTIIYDNLVLSSLPDGTCDYFGYNGLHGKTIFIEKIGILNLVFSMSWQMSYSSGNNYATFYTTIDFKSNSIWCNRFLDNSDLNERIYYEISNKRLCVKINVTRLIDDVSVASFKKWLDMHETYVYYEKTHVTRQLQFKELYIYTLVTLISVMSKVVPKLATRYYVDEISTVLGYDISDYVYSFVEEYAYTQDNNLSFGNTPSKNCSIGIKNYDENGDTILPNSIYKYRFNVAYEIYRSDNNSITTVPSGIFNVYENPERYTNDMTIELNDEMVLFDTYYNSSLVYPNTIKNQLKEIEETFHILVKYDTLSQTTLDTVIQSIDKTLTVRQYIGWIAEIDASNARMDYGELSFIKLTSQSTKHIALEYVTDYLQNEEIAISRVVFENGIDHYEYGNKSGNTIYVSSGNPYALGNQSAVENIFNQINGLKIMSFESMKTPLGNPLLQLGETVDIVDYDTSENALYKTVILGYSMDFNGGFSQTINSDVCIKTQNEIVQHVSPNTKLSGVQIKLDGMNGTIEQISTQIDEIDGTMNEVTQKITPTEIVNSVNSALANGSTINSVSTTLNKDGFLVKGGAIIVQNNAGTNVLYGDVDGNLTIVNLNAVNGTFSGKVTSTNGTIGGMTITSSGFTFERKNMTVNGINGNFKFVLNPSSYSQFIYWEFIPTGDSAEPITSYIGLEDMYIRGIECIGINAVSGKIDDIEYYTLTNMSDRRLKHDIKNDIDVSWIDNLKIKEFTYNNGKENRIGVIANEYVGKDYSKYFLSQNKNGYYSVDYMNILNGLIKYSQDLKKENDKLNVEINNLKEEIQAIKDMIMSKGGGL